MNRFQRPPSDAERTAQIQAAREELSADPSLTHAEREAYEPEMTVPLAQPSVGLSVELDANGPIQDGGSPVADQGSVEEAKFERTDHAVVAGEKTLRATISAAPTAFTPGNEPPENGVYIVMGRYPDARSGHPRFASYFEGGWFETSRNAPEPLVVWAWMKRDVLGPWPEEPV